MVRTALLGAVAAAALLGGVGAASAQSNTLGNPANETRVIQVPRGAVVLVLQPGAMSAMPMSAMPMMPFPAMPDPVAMLRQMDAQMARMNQMMEVSERAFADPAFLAPDRTIEAALQGMPVAGPGMRGVVVTSFSDGHGTCTRRVTYGGDGAAPKIEVSATGDASCGPAGSLPGATRPAAAPDIQTPQPAAPRTWRVENRVPPKSVAGQPMVVAELSD
jgi:hypothetical protein